MFRYVVFPWNSRSARSVLRKWPPVEYSIQTILKSSKIARLANHTTLVSLPPFHFDQIFSYPFCCQTAPRSTWQQPASHGSSKFQTLSQYQFYQSFIWKSTKSNPNRPKRPLISHCSKHLQPLRQTQPPSLPCLRKRGVQPHGLHWRGIIKWYCDTLRVQQNGRVWVALQPKLHLPKKLQFEQRVA